MRWLFWWQPPAMLRSVIVTLTGDDSMALKGVLWASRGPWLTLKDAALLKVNQPPTPMDGDVVVHRSKVAFLQALP